MYCGVRSTVVVAVVKVEVHEKDWTDVVELDALLVTLDG
jgi:hypothetical protein